MVKERVFEALKNELSRTEKEVDEALLRSKIDFAYEDVKMTRNYPSYYTEAMILDDMERYYSVIYSVAGYDYSKIGAEGQSSYSADGTSIKFEDRNSYFKNVDPIAR